METNSITQAGYKAGMIYSMIVQSIECRGITPPNLHTSQKKHYKFISQSHTYSPEILGTHSCIHCSSRNSFTYYPSPGACVVRSRGLPLVVVGMKSEVFLVKAQHLPQSDLFTVHSNRSKPFILYCSFLCVCTADHEMLRCRSPSLVFKASLFTPICSNPRPT